MDWNDFTEIRDDSIYLKDTQYKFADIYLLLKSGKVNENDLAIETNKSIAEIKCIKNIVEQIDD